MGCYGAGAGAVGVMDEIRTFLITTDISSSNNATVEGKKRGEVREGMPLRPPSLQHHLASNVTPFPTLLSGRRFASTSVVVVAASRDKYAQLEFQTSHHLTHFMAQPRLTQISAILTPSRASLKVGRGTLLVIFQKSIRFFPLDFV